LIDTHCHLSFSQFDTDLAQVVQRAGKADVYKMINVGIDALTSKKSVEISENYDNVFAAVGIHPNYADIFKLDDITEIARLARNKRVIAIGEIGLDYHRAKNGCNPVDVKVKLLQKKLFLQLIDLEEENNLPMILHCREAYDDLSAILKNRLTPPIKAVVHCFSGNKKFLEDCLDMGMYISFTANITYAKSGGLRDIVSYAPLEKFFLETDSPLLAPQIFRGKRNEPANVEILARQIALIKGIDFSKVCSVTDKNAENFFGLGLKRREYV